MAKINNFELKNVRTFYGHEGEPLEQGDVYYKGKKIGFWSQDAWGGMDNFNLNLDFILDKDLIIEINEKTKNYVGNVLFKDIDRLYKEKYCPNLVDRDFEHKGYEYLFEDLLQLREHESLYKKYSKKWNLNEITIIYKDIFTKQISGIGNRNNDKVYYTYTSLKDFVKEI